MSIRLGVLCNRDRKNACQHYDDQNVSCNDQYDVGQEYQRLRLSEWPDGLAATLGTLAKTLRHLFLEILAKRFLGAV